MNEVVDVIKMERQTHNIEEQSEEPKNDILLPHER